MGNTIAINKKARSLYLHRVSRITIPVLTMQYCFFIRSWQCSLREI